MHHNQLPCTQPTAPYASSKSQVEPFCSLGVFVPYQPRLPNSRVSTSLNISGIQPHPTSTYFGKQSSIGFELQPLPLFTRETHHMGVKKRLEDAAKSVHGDIERKIEQKFDRLTACQICKCAHTPKNLAPVWSFCAASNCRRNGREAPEI